MKMGRRARKKVREIGGRDRKEIER